MEQYSRVGVEPPAIIERTAPAGDWPQKGEITFSGVKMRYRHGLPLVLKGLTFSVRPREKIGIVGRTGAGKRYSLFLPIVRYAIRH
jgi:ATP-binding cassette subfamily C (CFTR/MRP) protein 5